MGKINKNELIEKVCDLVPKVTKNEISQVINEFIESMKIALRYGDQVSIKEFITLKPVRTKERSGRNPSTRQIMVIPAKNSVKAKLSENFIKSLN